METKVDEIAPDVYRLSTYVGKIELQFNQFLVKDEEPLLYHTGLRGMYYGIRDAVARVIDPETIRWIGFSHFEADECGSLNDWMSLAPHAKPVCGTVGALVNINDFVGGKAHALANDETFSTGKYRFLFLETPQVPHGWDASLLFEETQGTLFTSDLFLHNGDAPPLTENDVVEPARQALLAYQAGPLAHAFQYTPLMEETLRKLAGLKPKQLAIMHGSSFRGDGGRALSELAEMFAATLGENLKAL